MAFVEEEMPYIAHSTDFAAIREHGIEDFWNFRSPGSLRSSYSCDLGVSYELKMLNYLNSAIIDPEAFDERTFVSVQAESVKAPPNSFVLARFVVFFRIPLVV